MLVGKRFTLGGKWFGVWERVPVYPTQQLLTQRLFNFCLCIIRESAFYRVPSAVRVCRATPKITVACAIHKFYREVMQVFNHCFCPFLLLFIILIYHSFNSLSRGVRLVACCPVFNKINGFAVLIIRGRHDECENQHYN